MANEHIVIAGGGLAGGATAAKTLRAEGYGGDVTVVGAEQRTPYIRPPLSKEFLLGKADADSARSTRGGLVRGGERRRASSWQPRQPDLP